MWTTPSDPGVATGCTPCEEFSLEPVSHETVIEYLQTLPFKKATGCDNMPTHLVNEAAQAIGPSITKLSTILF